MAHIEELQFLNQVLESKDWGLVSENNITSEHFTVHKDAFEFVESFRRKNGQLPTVETVLNKFDTFELVEPENIKTVVEALNEDLYHRMFKPVLKEAAHMVANKDSINAIQKVYVEAGRLLKSVGQQGIGYSYVGNAQQRFENYLKIHGRNENDILGMTTGFVKLDRAVNGIEFADAVDYFLVLAPTNMGKTLIASYMLQATWMNADMTCYPAYFALEQKAEEIAHNWDNVLARVSRLALTRGTMSGEMKDRYAEFIDRLKQKKKDMVIYDLRSNGGKPFSVEEIRRIIEREGHTVFTLDQLSKIRKLATFGGDLRQRLFDVSAEVREMILDLGIPGYVVAQANRDSAKRVKKDADSEVTGEDVGETYAIVQDASKGISVTKINDNTFRITVIKNRNNASGQSFLIRYDFETGLVVPLDDEIGEQYF